MNTRDTLRINEKGHLEIGGCDAAVLAEKFGTPLYVMDEQYIRDMCRVYRDTIDTEYGGNGSRRYAREQYYNAHNHDTAQNAVHAPKACDHWGERSKADNGKRWAKMHAAEMGRRLS